MVLNNELSFSRASPALVLRFPVLCCSCSADPVGKAHQESGLVLARGFYKLWGRFFGRSVLIIPEKVSPPSPLGSTAPAVPSIPHLHPSTFLLAKTWTWSFTFLLPALTAPSGSALCTPPQNFPFSWLSPVPP